MSKWIYNNYQFYETGALSKFIREQAKSGYEFSGAIGNFLDIMKFKYKGKSAQDYYVAFRNRWDDEIDNEIANIKISNQNDSQIVYEGYLYTIVKSANPEKLKKLEAKQNSLLGIPIKRRLLPVAFWLVISIVSYFIKLLWLKEMSFSLFLSPIILITFIFYFIADLHDYFAGKGFLSNGKIYFCERSKFKNIMFRIADVIKLCLFICFAYSSAFYMLQTNDQLERYYILTLWIIYLVGSYIARLKDQRFYISLLQADMFITFFVF